MVPDKARDAYEALALYADQPVREFRAFVDRMDSEMRPVIEAIRAGNPPETPPHLEFTFKLEIPKALSDRFTSALAAMHE